MRHLPIALRCRWLLRALGRSPLVRATDRIEALAALMVAVVAVLAVPFASQASDDTYDAQMKIIDEQVRTRHSVEAVAVSGSNTTPGRYNRPGPVRAQWREGTQERTEMVNSPTIVNEGATLTVWLDNTGTVVPPPDTPQLARSIAAGRAWTVWLGTVAVTALLAYATKRGLDRLRALSWERELQLLAHNDDGWADRHT
jgi:Trk-type K+ transport system membrane component